MQILLANAKMMVCPTEVAAKPLTIPAFQAEADLLAKEMARLSLDELAEQLGCSRQLALENQQRYQNFFLAEKVPAIMAYNGRAYQALMAHTFEATALSFAQEHLFITCFLYGLLRPMDAIVPYRMEHTVRLEATNDKPIDRFWRDKLTDYLIRAVQADDGILIHLSTGEYERLFNWARVCREVKVIKPLFMFASRAGCTCKPFGQKPAAALWCAICSKLRLTNHQLWPTLLTKAFPMRPIWANRPSPIS